MVVVGRYLPRTENTRLGVDTTIHLENLTLQSGTLESEKTIPPQGGTMAQLWNMVLK
jgi:hypothetical protein